MRHHQNAQVALAGAGLDTGTVIFYVSTLWSTATVSRRVPTRSNRQSEPAGSETECEEKGPTHSELGFGEREGVPKMQHSVHVRVRKSYKVLFLLLVRGAGLRGVGLEAFFHRPPLLRDLLQLDQLVAARKLLSSTVIRHHTREQSEN